MLVVLDRQVVLNVRLVTIVQILLNVFLVKLEHILLLQVLLAVLLAMLARLLHKDQLVVLLVKLELI